MIQITQNDILELGAKYGLTNAILGYSDFEKLLVLFGTQIYVKGFNDGTKYIEDISILTDCKGWEA